MSCAESRLWELLRNRRFEGLKFRRQTPVAGVVADLFCPQLKLVIELDGGIHDLKQTEDAARDARVEAAGFTVLRFRNNTVLDNPAVVLEAIRRHAAGMPNQPPHPTGSAGHLLPRGEKET